MEEEEGIIFGAKNTAVWIRNIPFFFNFTFFALQDVFLHQILPFLVCRLVIKLFCGIFNNFGKIPLMGPKMQKRVPKICHFLNFHIFSNSGCISSQNIVIFGLQAFIKLLFGSFIRIQKEYPLGGGWKLAKFLWKKMHCRGVRCVLQRSSGLFYVGGLMGTNDTVA